MTSLASKPQKPPENEMPAASPVMDGPRFPRLRLDGDQAEAAGLHKCGIGDTYDITIRVKASRLGGDEYEMRGSGKPPAEFEVISADKPTEVSEEGGEAKKNPKGVKTPRQSGFKAAYESDD